MTTSSAASLTSVVLTTHNRPAWLADALGSVLGGEFDDFEVIVTNSGDPDDTRRLRRTIRDPRVRWFDQPPGLGMLDNLLAGLARARGEYVAILHDDDRWSPRFLAVLVPPLERHPDVVLAFCDHHVIDDGGRVDGTATESATRRFGRADLSEGVIRDFLAVVIRQSVKITGCVWRRDALALDELSPGVAPHLDVWLSYLLARDGAAVYYSPQRLMSYRLHRGAHSASRDPAVWLAGIQCGERMLCDPRLDMHAGVLVRRVAGYHRLAAEGMLREGMRRPARAHLAAAMHLCPTPRAVAGWAASWVAPQSLLARL
jgi:glycosyltransferase involved in cell wall biosynthesis